MRRLVPPVLFGVLIDTRVTPVPLDLGRRTSATLHHQLPTLIESTSAAIIERERCTSRSKFAIVTGADDPHENDRS